MQRVYQVSRGTRRYRKYMSAGWATSQEMYLSCCKYSDRQSHAYAYNSRRKKERERMALIFSRGLYCNKIQSCANERNTATIGIPWYNKTQNIQLSLWFLWWKLKSEDRQNFLECNRNLSRISLQKISRQIRAAFYQILLFILLFKSKSIKFYWFQCYIYNYINQWNMHCLSVIIHWFWLVKVLPS